MKAQDFCRPRSLEAIKLIARGLELNRFEFVFVDIYLISDFTYRRICGIDGVSSVLIEGNSLKILTNGSDRFEVARRVIVVIHQSSHRNFDEDWRELQPTRPPLEWGESTITY